MKALRALVTILVLGALLALGVEHLGIASAHAVQPPAGLVSMAVVGGLPVCAADTNNDQQVNSADLSVLLGQFGTNVAPGTGADFNNDGLVNSADLSVLLAAFGLACVECNVSGDCAAPPNMVANCVGGDCQYACMPGYLNCNASLVDGCEIDSTTDIAHCGGCNLPCAFANGVAACINGVCTLAGCNPGFGNCDGNPTNGCETNTNNSLAHCGSCNTPCNLPNAISFCVDGVCTLLGCDAGFANCDGITANGCETNTNTNLSHCGNCNQTCNLPNATETCVAGVCTLTSCDLGFANCDGITANGCEVNLNVASNSCVSAENLGTHCGDIECGFLCPTSSTVVFATRQLRGERWYRARATECANCSATVRHVIRLNVPTGIDYDLYVYSTCGGTLLGSSALGGDADETVTINRSDDAANDDSFNYWIEIRYWNGSSCANWVLTVEGRDC